METEEQVIARHRKENKELISKITSMKKQATKSTKKEVSKQCEQLEKELKARHEQELKDAQSAGAGVGAADNVEGGEQDEDEDEFSPEKLLAELELEEKAKQAAAVQKKQPQKQQQPAQKGPKRNRQKERLAKRQALIEEEKRKAQEEADLQPNFKEIENETIKQLCSIANLVEFDIKPDGNCLFASISDQLKTRQNIDISVKELRSKAANHIRNDPDTFIPYMFDEETMQLKNLDEYTDKIENTAAWGSDLEILALAKEFDSPISIMMSGRATLRMNEEGHNPELKLVYYKHSYALGEHYNSLRDKEEEVQGEAEEEEEEDQDQGY